MRRTLSLLILLGTLLFAAPSFAQLLLPVCPSGINPCSGQVQAPIDQNGWQNYKVILTQNITFSFNIIPPTPPPAQSVLRAIFTENATGGFTVTFASNIINPCAVTTPANTTTICSFTYDGTTGNWQGISGANGGSGAPAFQNGTNGPPVPKAEVMQEGTSTTGVTSRNLNTPLAYWSRWDSSTNATCQVGLIDACASPVNRIDFTNGNTGTTNTPIGLLINGWGFQGLTPNGQNGGAAIAFATVMADLIGNTGNTDIRGENFNIVVNGNPSGLDRAGLTRSAFGTEMDITNASGNDCSFIKNSGSGNYCGAASIVAAGANNSTVGLAIGSSASSGKGYLDGEYISGAVNVGQMIVKGNGVATGVGHQQAAGGTYGYACGGTSITPPINQTDTLAPPAICAIFEPKTGAANNDSLPEVFRAFAADTSHVNEWQINARNANTTLRWAIGSNCAFTIGANPSPCGSYTDEFAMGSGGSFFSAANLCTNANLANLATFGCISGAFTGQRTFTVPDSSGSVLITGNGTGTAMQTKRVSGCVTGAAQFNTCDTTVTWTTAFADANYTAHCTGDVVTSGVPQVEGIDISAAKAGASITVRTIALTAVAAQFTTIDCTAVHD